MKNIKKSFFPVMFILPFILGIIGYLMENESFLDSVYNSICLYKMSPMYEEKNILIEISRWLAPAVVASGLIVFIKEISVKIKDFFICLKKESVAVYGDDEGISLLKKNIKNTVVSGDNSVKDAKNQIIMFKDEMKSFNFYNENREFLENKTVFIKSDSIEMFKNDSNKFKIVNFNEIAARNYWVEHNLMQYFAKGQEEIQIAIIGFDNVGRRLLDSAILNNIYSLKQKITYHIWGETAVYSAARSDIKLMNSDEIIFHSESWQSSLELISKSDRIIFPVLPDISSLVMMAEKYENSEIHCYNLDENMPDITDNPRILSFGQSSKVLTKENIFSTDIYYSAKRLNFRYACLYGEAKETDGESAIEAEWKKLDSFTKNSNITATNYHLIRKIITQHKQHTDSELAEMEHIRWCRFHFMNHWKEGKTANGKKDSINKIHPCLVKFDDLSAADKQKDIEAIEVLNEVFI